MGLWTLSACIEFTNAVLIVVRRKWLAESLLILYLKKKEITKPDMNIY